MHKTIYVLGLLKLLQLRLALFLVLGCFIVSASPESNICDKSYLTRYEFSKLLHEKNQSLHSVRSVEKVNSSNRRAKKPVSQKPYEKLKQWIDALEKIQKRGESNKVVLEKLRNHYHKHFIIKPENVPESYFDHQIELARQRGYGRVDITNEQNFIFNLGVIL